jgi:hypothetical protein
MNEIDTGLKILASIIARAYLKDLSGNSPNIDSYKKKEEGNNGNQGCIGNHQAASARENPVGHKEGNQ